MCRWKRHEREGRLEFEVHSEWMRRTRRIGQMRPADAEGSKARQGVWVLGPGSIQSVSPSRSCLARQPVALWEWARWEGGACGASGHPMGGIWASQIHGLLTRACAFLGQVLSIFVPSHPLEILCTDHVG